MKWLGVLILFVLNATGSSAQLGEDFSDGDHLANPQWHGDTGAFKVDTAGTLTLSAPSAGAFFISTANSYSHGAEWQLYIRLNFSPSAANYVRVYLMSSSRDLEEHLNGYYLQLGESGSLDGIDLFRQDGTAAIKLIDGINGHAAKNINSLRIKITRSNTGLWELFADTLGGVDFQKEGEITDSTHSGACYFGIIATVTSSNINKISFDDFSIRLLQPDLSPPGVKSILPLDSNRLEVIFDEPLNSSSVSEKTNYLISGFGIPKAVALASCPHNKVILEFSKNFTGRTTYDLNLYDIKDISGNVLTATYSFTYFIPSTGNVVINEVFPDTSPVVALPSEEFIELYNTTDFDISLNGWSLSDAASTATLPDDSIPAKGFILLVPSKSVGIYSAYGKTLGLNPWPSLNNALDVITLADAQGRVVDKISYTSLWYKYPQKDDGGWTLERIDPWDTCSVQEPNWAASSDSTGGTPGKINSLYLSPRDTTAPYITALWITDSLSIELTLSEIPDSSGIHSAQFLLNDTITPSSVIVNSNVIRLKFTAPFIHGTEYSLSSQPVQDCRGNSKPLLYDFKYYQPETASRYDVLFTEIMADPEPSVALPGIEFIELYNRSSKPLSLKNWKLADGSTTALLPDFILLPDSFILLCGSTGAPALSVYAKVLPVKLPSLGNERDTLILTDSLGIVIDFVAYDKGWHADALKAAGGWTLERIDPGNPCGQEQNWTSSKHQSGGTPGRKNSVDAINPDIRKPRVVKLFPVDSLHVSVTFDEHMDSASLVKDNFSIEPGLKIMSVKTHGAGFSRIILELDQPLETGMVYYLKITNTTDCAGNIMTETELPLGLPQVPDSFDLVINEILFNPWTGGVDFIELCNRSQKVIDISQLYLAEIDINTVSGVYPVSPEPFMLMPGDYVVITPDPENILSNYQVKFSENLIKATLPVMPDDEGHIALIRKNGTWLDDLSYFDDWHFPLLASLDGVSLEKINPGFASRSSWAWHSASTTVGYATPTYRNSQYTEGTPLTDSLEIKLDPPIFSPDNDGYQDVLNINLRFPKPGFAGKVVVYDLAGRPVSELSGNQVFSTEGVMTWDGIINTGEKALPGAYIILVSVFHPDGDTRVWKLGATLSGRF
ncbi:MAG: lamin tail domain-containing protein [Bacteroidota bacterium]|nr:lamin tail domain-containing protein [Bacteroidota bacterium]